MGAIEPSIDFIQNEFPEVSIHKEDAQLIFEGRFILRGKHKDFVMETAPKLKLIMHKDYPHILPTVIDVDNVIDYDHKFEDKSLCVATPIDISLGLLNSLNISDYINGFLIPYFISYEYWKQSGKKIDIYGDRSHGYKGIIESLADFFNVDCRDEKKILLLFAWAARINKFKKLFPKEQHHNLIKKHCRKIEMLRKLGIGELKRFCNYFKNR